MAIQFKKLTATIPAGTNVHTFTDSLINNNSVIEVYTDNDDVYPVNLEQHGNSIEVTLSAHSNAVGVALTINNVVTYEPTDISGLEDEIQSVSDNLSGLTSVVNEISDNVDNIEGDISALGGMVTDLETNKQDVLTAGANITIENNVISAIGGGSSQDIYDADEHVVGTWFGKPLYRIVIKQAFGTYSSAHLVPLNVENVEKIVNYYGFRLAPNGTATFLNGSNPSTGYFMYIDRAEPSGVYYRSGGWSSGDFYAVVWYTKTTD